MYVWDTAGQERYLHIVHSHMCGAQGVIYALDPTEPLNLELIKAYIETCIDTCGNIPIQVVTTKCDITLTNDAKDAWALSVKALEAMLAEILPHQHLPIIQTSAKNDINVAHAFETLARTILNTTQMVNSSSFALHCDGQEDVHAVSKRRVNCCVIL